MEIIFSMWMQDCPDGIKLSTLTYNVTYRYLMRHLRKEIQEIGQKDFISNFCDWNSNDGLYSAKLSISIQLLLL